MNPAPPAAPFRHSLLTWYRKNRRDLPWRRSADPYAILVSEFMLQQTQVATVIPYYKEWLRRFPDFATLAAASENDVLHAWQGLGYYTRARNLRATAIVVMERHAGIFPRDLDSIRKLPGIGQYTANAIATFAFDQSVPIVEANIARVVSRVFELQTPIDTTAGRERLWSTAAQLLPRRSAGQHNSALMELGALVCTARPKCPSCPVRTFCRSTDPTVLPRKKARPPLQFRTEHHGFALRRRRVLLEQSQHRWRGMWILPTLANAPATLLPMHRSEFPFTHHRITLAIYSDDGSDEKRNQNQRWFPIHDLDSIPLPSPHRRALDDILISVGLRSS
ncbi:MAG: A/G-specific adenine glycosylase [Verrucomicrobiota bacterium]|nr:A/G-specific adenine glycosylase [Verrucomicrobiota bacterium]